jgi:hypothetical protein
MRLLQYYYLMILMMNIIENPMLDRLLFFSAEDDRPVVPQQQAWSSARGPRCPHEDICQNDNDRFGGVESRESNVLLVGRETHAYVCVCLCFIFLFAYSIE